MGLQTTGGGSAASTSGPNTFTGNQTFAGNILFDNTARNVGDATNKAANVFAAQVRDGANYRAKWETSRLAFVNDADSAYVAVRALAFQVGANQVVGAQGAAVADATGAGDVVAQLNALLARLRAHGLIAT